MSAWRIQRRTVSSAIPKSTATSATLRSPRLATVTTSRLNSAGNFFGIVPSFQREHFPQ
jgi:hypothetical protein